MKDYTGEDEFTVLSAASIAACLPQLLDAATDNAIVVDAGGAIIATTAKWPPHEDGRPLAGRPCHEVLGSDSPLATILDDVLAGRRGPYEQIEADPAQARWQQQKIVPLREMTCGQLLGAIVVLRDVSTQMQAEKRASDILAFMAGLVHDLRTQLNAIIGFSEMMVREHWGPVGNEHYLSYIQHIHTAGSHLLTQVNQVLDLSKIEAQRQELCEDVVNLTEVLQQCCNTIQDLAARSGLNITVETAPDHAPEICADLRLVRQVALNLLSNAIKFTPSGGQIAATTGLDDDGRPFIAVRDTGIGIAAEHMAKVMEPFGQVDSPQARRHGHHGTGLGLPLSKKFMELHGGTLLLDSAPNQGTAAIARFPRDRVILPAARD